MSAIAAEPRPMKAEARSMKAEARPMKAEARSNAAQAPSIAARPDGARPWYGQFWPWVLIALPAASVAISVVALVLAIRHGDAVVGEDWYVRGLAINQDLDRSAAAARLGVAATLAIDGGDLVVTLTGDASVEALTVELQHPTLASNDRRYVLAPSGASTYRAVLADPLVGRWYVTVRPASGAWRLAAPVTLAPGTSAQLRPAT